MFKENSWFPQQNLPTKIKFLNSKPIHLHVFSVSRFHTNQTYFFMTSILKYYLTQNKSDGRTYTSWRERKKHQQLTLPPLLFIFIFYSHSFIHADASATLCGLYSVGIQ